MSLKFDGSIPELDLPHLSILERDLGVRLSEDYKRFLLQYNGGFVPKGIAYRFDVPIRQIRSDRIMDEVGDGVHELFGYNYSANVPHQRRPDSLIVVNRRYAQEEFLPRKVIAVGRTGTDSLICLSANRHDFGSVYYWYYYWQYPWARDHFESKIEAVQNSYPRFEEVAGRQEGEEFEMLADQLNYATLTRIATSFDAFLARLREVSDKG